MVQLFLDYGMIIFNTVVVSQLTVLKINKKNVESDLLIYIWLSFISIIGFEFKFDLLSYAATNIVYFNFLIPFMMISRYLKSWHLFWIIVLFLVMIIFFSILKPKIHGTVYCFGIGLLIYLIDVVKEIKSNLSGSIYKIFILLILTYNLFFLGLSNHPELWIASQFKSAIQIVFWGQLVLFYSYILYTHARIKY